MATAFIDSLEQAPHAFLTPTLPLRTDIIQYIKHVLNPVAVEVGEIQQTRLQDARKKRKRGVKVAEDGVLRLKQIHTNGMRTAQVWEQARRIIEATKQEAARGLAEVHAASDGSDAGSDLGMEGVDYTVEGEDGELDLDDTAEISEDLDSDGDITKDALDDEDIEMDSEEENEEQNGPAEVFVADKFGLNDGFFSIDNFNRQSEFLEQRDYQGENDGAASEEEDVDWDTNPLGTTNGTIDQQANVAEASDDDENGPTFGDPDAQSEDEQEMDGGEMDGLGGVGNTNDILYTDFFAPPARKKSKKKAYKPKAAQPEPEVDNIERTMAAVQRDLFDDEDEDEDNSDAEDLDPADPRSRKSAHERRQAALAEEIRTLENANVAKREWALSGEARAADRPVNSLLEEDLDFERTGKPVPVITAEISESIEELIKRRILAYDFQDIPRRRPDDLTTGKEGRRGRMDFTLDDNQSKKGLAEEYEEEHLRKTDPNFVDVKDEKLAKEQTEIESLWKDICGKLDSLSSWHFRPKQPTTQLDIRVDAPTITMEDARPNAGGDVATSQLAPQEIYKAGDGSKGHNEEVVGKSGLPAGREELSREDTKRRRRREKERIRKASGNQPSKPASKKSKDQSQMLSDLKKANVKVADSKGELTDVSGNAIAAPTTHTAANFKL